MALGGQVSRRDRVYESVEIEPGWKLETEMTVFSRAQHCGCAESHQHRPYGARLSRIPFFLFPFPAQRLAPTSKIYTWRFCPSASRQGLLDSQGVPYQDFAIDGDNAAPFAMAERARGRKKPGPRSFIDGPGIGGLR